MSGKPDKQRIVALQKALRIARAALEKAKYDGLSRTGAEDALDEMNQLDWHSKPSSLARLLGHEGRRA